MTGSPLALVEIDLQRWILAEADADADAVARAARAVRDDLRDRGALVVCTRYLGRDRADPLRSDPDGPGAAFHALTAPEPGDLVLTKYGPDVTDNPDLHANLRLAGVGEVVLTGVATEHGVARAARSLHALGYRVRVAAGACAGFSRAAHDAALRDLAADGIVVDATPAPPIGAAGPDCGAAPMTIAQVADATGLTRDTLRWYEREGVLPAVDRDGAGRRVYDPATVGLVLLLVGLRRTGMPVAEVRRFVTLVGEGAASHGRRAALLRAHRARLLAHVCDTRLDLTRLDDKIAHYERLIDAGLDCGDAPVTDPDVLAAQRSSR